MSQVQLLEEAERASPLEISEAPCESPRHLTRCEEAEPTSPLKVSEASRASPLHLATQLQKNYGGIESEVDDSDNGSDFNDEIIDTTMSSLAASTTNEEASDGASSCTSSIS